LQERNIFLLANERQLRQLRTDKHLEEFQGHAPTENFVIYRLSKREFHAMCGNIL
jgi:hypothetical protein